MLRDLKRLDEARRVLDAGVAEARQVYREPHPNLATILNNLALVEQDQKDYAGAETHFREVLQNRPRGLGERHADVASDLHNLAWFLHKYRGRSAEGEAVSRQAVAMRAICSARGTRRRCRRCGSSATSSAAAASYAAALPLYREALRSRPRCCPRGIASRCSPRSAWARR